MDDSFLSMAGFDGYKAISTANNVQIYYDEDGSIAITSLL